MDNYDFKTIKDIIDVCENYKSKRKRTRDDYAKGYNKDLETLCECLIPLKKLNSLIGMDDIKKNIIDQLLFYAQDLNTDEMMHICLTGPPGVGKTTVGKILAEIYCSLGFLKTDNFKVVGRDDLIAGYIGQTAIKTKKILKESLGGVLFIDEAYSLGSDDDYSRECLDTINHFLSENTSNFIMIIAGYKKELDRCFFSVNSGLRRRFPWVYDIKSYTNNNLKDIFIYQITQNNWYLDEELKKENILDSIFLDKSLFDNNGGDTLALFDKTKICHSRRVFGQKKKFKKKINFKDIEIALQLLKENKDKRNNHEPPYGMYV